MAKITKSAVDRLLPGRSLWDAETRGFGVRKQSRDATYVLKARIHRRQRFFTIGKHGAPWTVETARKEAVRLLGLVAEGRDPASERDRADNALTVNGLAEAFMLRHVEAKRKPSTAAFYRHVLDAHVLPTLGRRRAIDVTRADVAKLHNDLRGKRQDKTESEPTSKTAERSKGGPYIANRALAIIASMYSWAGNAGLIADAFNPAARVERFAEQRRERFLTTDEIDRIGTALREAETTGLPWIVDGAKAKHVPKKDQRTRLSPNVTAAIRLLMFTGCRLREILHLEWQHVDLERGVLFLADSKTGKKTVVLAAPALAVLASLERVGRYVIAGESAGNHNEKPRSDLKRPWAQLTRRAKLEGVRIHDLRHTFASFGAGSNIGLPMIGKLLGHAQSRTTERYAHLAVDPLRRSADVIAGQIANALGEAPERGGVVPLRKGGAV